jgi:predicted Zn-dependent protease
MRTPSSKCRLTTLPLLLLAATTIFSQQPEKTATEYVLAGIAAQKAGKHEEALQQYAAAIKLEPKNFGAQFNSGVSLMILHRPQEGLSAFKIAAALSPNDAVVQFALAKAYAATDHAGSYRSSQRDNTA